MLFTEDFADAGGPISYLGVYFLVMGFDSLTVLLCLHLMDGRGLEAYLMAIIVGYFCAAGALAIVIART